MNNNFDFKAEKTKALKGDVDFQIIAKVNIYNELCNPFPRIENPFLNQNYISQITPKLKLDNSSSQLKKGL